MTVGPMFPKPQKRPKKPKQGLRRSRMRKSPPKRLGRAGADPAYLNAVRALPCFIRVGCNGPVHAHHAIHRSQGGKDRDAVPLCMTHHRDIHEFTGYFAGFTRETRSLFADAAIALTRGTLGR